MGTNREKLILFLSDLVTICAAWWVYYQFRVRSGWIDYSIQPDFWLPMVVIYLYWLLVFFVVGLYRPWYASSRFDELTLLFKAISLGSLFLFFAVFVDDQGRSLAVSSRFLIAVYWTILFTFVSTGRMLIRSIQRRLLIAGIGVHNTIIIGSAQKAGELFDEIKKYPALGYKVIGFAGIDNRWSSGSRDGIEVLGSISNLGSIIEKEEVRDVLVALDSSDHDKLLDIIAKCSPYNVGMKIIPDLYDIISGQARTNQIYGFPLIEISPHLMAPWEESAKRLLDMIVSGLVLVIGFPVWLLVGILVRLESPGPALYVQDRVGRDGKVFKIYKFRSMRQDAEKGGPQWAGKSDPRVTRLGKWLRRLHIDEIPQVLNVLKGDMSLVGPRPERPVFVEKLATEIPLYKRRLRVRPGVTGWAQVKHKYDETIEDVRKKVQYDLFYIENMSWRMDVKIILNTVFHSFMGRGQ